MKQACRPKQLGRRRAAPHILHTQCSHDGLHKDSYALMQACTACSSRLSLCNRVARRYLGCVHLAGSAWLGPGCSEGMRPSNAVCKGARVYLSRQRYPTMEFAPTSRHYIPELSTAWVAFCHSCENWVKKRLWAPWRCAPMAPGAGHTLRQSA